MDYMDSLWGDEFTIEETPESTKKLLNKVKNPKKAPKVVTEKSLKSKTVPIEEKLVFIKQNVLRILGVYKENTQVIKTKQELVDYIDAAIANGVIAVDTETNNSLTPITCKLMGPCIYTPGQKNAYIPINHVDIKTGERLDWQLTEEDIAEQFKRLSDTKIIFHNAKFDYQVIKCTTGVALDMYWDTLIGAKILDENERAGLKQQYIQKIDPSIEKYDIEHLFEGIEYAVVDPEIFALYAATDAFMTYKLYLWQQQQFEKPDNQKIYYVFREIEMPVIVVAAEMELIGVSIDNEYAQRLSAKYHKKTEALDAQMEAELKKYDSQIAQWRLTSEANYKPPKKTGEGFGKSKNEQLSDPVALSSPTQLAILFYDVLGIKPVDKKSPRGTGEEILTKINEKHKIPLCDLILQKRGLEKLIGTYIDKLPECVCEKDGRLHAHFNQYGAGCVVGDTQILTDNGYICIKDIFDGTEKDGVFYEQELTVVNKDLEYEQASHRVVYYDRPTKKIILDNGIELEGTYNHPIICASDDYHSDELILNGNVNYKKLEEICIGDSVIIPSVEHHLYGSSKVVDIIDSRNTVYDLHVPETHSFISNGIISHNTGRFSSSDPNLQNIPSHEKSIRMMFKAATTYDKSEIIPEGDFENCIISKLDDVQTPDGWVNSKDIKVNDIICSDTDKYIVSHIDDLGDNIKFYIYGVA